MFCYISLTRPGQLLLVTGGRESSTTSNSSSYLHFGTVAMATGVATVQLCISIGCFHFIHVVCTTLHYAR